VTEGDAGGPGVRPKKGAIATLDQAPPDESVVICLDEMGPEAAKSFPGRELVHAQPQPQADGEPAPAERAKQEADYGRRGKGYIFGACRPATGEALTLPYPGRTIANWTNFLEQVDGWLPSDAARGKHHRRRDPATDMANRNRLDLVGRLRSYCLCFCAGR